MIAIFKAALLWSADLNYFDKIAEQMAAINPAPDPSVIVNKKSLARLLNLRPVSRITFLTANHVLSESESQRLNTGSSIEITSPFGSKKLEWSYRSSARRALSTLMASKTEINL